MVCLVFKIYQNPDLWSDLFVFIAYNFTNGIYNFLILIILRLDFKLSQHYEPLKIHQ